MSTLNRLLIGAAVVLAAVAGTVRAQARFTWKLAPSFNEAAFSVVPPRDFGRVVFHDLK